MSDFFRGTPRTAVIADSEAIRRAEVSLGLRLPSAYVRLLSEQNGGYVRRPCFPTSRKTSWAPDHIQVRKLLGVGFEDGIDGTYGSRYMIREWGYPDVGIVIFDCPSGGHDTVMLDYRNTAPSGEPGVVYIDEDRSILPLAPDFDRFVAGLLDESKFRA